MIWPSGLLSGRDIFSTSRATMRFTATSSGASTSRDRLPETSSTRTRVLAISFSSASSQGALRLGRQTRGEGAVLRVVEIDRNRERLPPDLKCKETRATQHRVDLIESKEATSAE